MLQIPIAHYADRGPRVRLALLGAVAWSLFSFATGLAFTLWFLVVARSGSGLGKAVVDPTHNSLIADYYPPDHRPKVYSFHRAANAVGAFIGPLLAGIIAFNTSWRVPFFVFAVPTLIVVALGWRVKEPVRGEHERRAMGASDEAMLTEEAPPSFGEALAHLRSHRDPPSDLVGAAVPRRLADRASPRSPPSSTRRCSSSTSEPVASWRPRWSPPSSSGSSSAARIGTKLVARDPGLILRFLGVLSFIAAGLFAGFALSPWLWLVGGRSTRWSPPLLAAIGPGIFAALAMAIPPRARAFGFSIGSLWVLPGLLILPIVGGLGDRFGLRQAMLLMLPVFVVGGLILSSAGRVIVRDITQVWTTAAARSEVAYERRQGRSKLLLVRDLDVSYCGVQVLFDVNLEVDEGEIIALLGTNGAGKSTLLRTISGIVEADRGAIIFDGVDMTATPPAEIAGRGVLQVPGGVGTFPSLTVRQNLEVATWLQRGDAKAARAAIERVLALFPVLETRQQEPAANLSGGQQQQLALGMAFLSRPRLLMIDELSIGLAPVIVEQLLPLLRELRDEGTTIILVEQSVNVALTLAETAYFMEKGEIRFSGATADLLERPDLLRSVFLEGAGPGHRQRRGGCPRARPRQGRRDQRRGRRGERSGAGAADARPHPFLRWGPSGRRRVDQRGARRGGGDHRSQRCGEDHALRRDLRVHPGGQRADPPRRARHQRALAEPPSPARSGPLVPGRPPLPRHDRGRGAGREPRALRRHEGSR